MKNLVIICCIGLLASCHQNQSKKPLFNTLEFSFTDFKTSSFTVKFTQSDTAFVREYFVYYDTLKKKDNRSYFALLLSRQIKTLDSFINKTDFQNFDSAYYDYEDYKDETEYLFYFKKKSFTKTIFVHSYHEPPQLQKFAHWIVALRDSLKYQKINSDTILFHIGRFEPRLATPEMLLKNNTLSKQAD